MRKFNFLSKFASLFLEWQLYVLANKCVLHILFNRLGISIFSLSVFTKAVIRNLKVVKCNELVPGVLQVCVTFALFFIWPCRPCINRTPAPLHQQKTSARIGRKARALNTTVLIQNKNFNFFSFFQFWSARDAVVIGPSRQQHKCHEMETATTTTTTNVTTSYAATTEIGTTQQQLSSWPKYDCHCRDWKVIPWTTLLLRFSVNC